MTTTAHYDPPGTERAEQFDPADAARRAAAYAARHPDSAPTADPEPIEAQRPAQGACRCPRAGASASAQPLDCTCAWDELLSAIMHLAYGADPATIASAGPAIATMAHDLIYGARNAALRTLADQWPGTRAAFAKAHKISRAHLYNIVN